MNETLSPLQISSTGFRIVYLLNLLLLGPVSKEEIIKYFLEKENFKITNEEIKLDIKTLKNAGFLIENLRKSGDFKYKITESPIKIHILKKELKVLKTIRNAILEVENRENIINLYTLFEKISNFIQNEETLNEFMDFGYFLNIDFRLLIELERLTKAHKNVLLLYNSPNSGKKEIEIELKEIKYNNSKLYITGKSPMYKGIAVLRADKILKIIKILKPLNEIFETKNVVFEVLTKDFKLLEEEIILEKTEETTKIRIKSDNDFMTVQRLLAFGEDLVKIYDPVIKAKYKQTLIEILNLYKKEEQSGK